MPDNKEIYRQLCETEGSNIPLFQQYWWMETVCRGKQWNVLICKGHGTVCGVLPFLYGKKFGLKYILLPQLTPWGGPWVDPTMDDDSRKWVLVALAAGLHRQKAVLCMQRLAPGENDWQPFEKQGFSHTTRYTYRFDPIPAPATLRSLAAKERRKGVEAVEAAYCVDRQVDVSEFAEFHTSYWERRSGRDLLDRDFIQRVCTAALSRGQGLLYGLRDQKGVLMAARFVVFDDRCAYSLMSALHADALRNSMTFLVWTLIGDLYGRTQAFDFEGGMDPGIGHFYRSFGTTQTPIHCIYLSKIPWGNKLLRV